MPPITSYRSARATIRAALAAGQQEPVKLSNIRPEIASKIVAELQSPSLEGRALRFSYDKTLEEVTITMPSSFHEFIFPWMHRVMVEWESVLPADHDDFFLIQEYNCFVGRYEGFIKEPDFCLGPLQATFPSLVVEIGVPESYAQLLRDKDLWLQGSGGETKIVFLIKTKRADPLVASFEIWRASGSEIYALFPEPIDGPPNPTLPLSELCGDIEIPETWDPSIQLLLDLEKLRKQIRKCVLRITR
ncbi:hypothetical protein ABW21_db0201810 [Orbilia brochopaga]|nr:hypothetical protein ABW21_db0201810 [Drechslerella brochopaga]